MQIATIRTTPTFDKHYRKLAKKIKEAAKNRECLFRANPFHTSLGTHKLHGRDRDLWAFWINQKYRIKFLFLDGHAVLFVDIGTHDIYS